MSDNWLWIISTNLAVFALCVAAGLLGVWLEFRFRLRLARFRRAQIVRRCQFPL